eukprot:1161054-Pelagomonas_calceolata.AAC.2
MVVNHRPFWPPFRWSFPKEKAESLERYDCWSGVTLSKSPATPPTPRTAAPSLLAALQVLHQSSPHHQQGKLAQARAKLAAMEAAAALAAEVKDRTSSTREGRAAVMRSEEMEGYGWKAGGLTGMVGQVNMTSWSETCLTVHC